MGDIPGLAAKIAELGLLQPPVVDPNGRLVCGERRLLAARHLGWTDIPVHVVDIDAVVRGEFAENTCRKDFTPSELVAIGREVERVERDRAKVRKAHDGRPAKLPEGLKGDSRDKVAAQLGMGARSYEKAKAVVEAAEAEPQVYGHLVEELDRYRGVDRAYRALRTAKDEARVLGLQPRDGKFRMLVVDVPWAYDTDWLGRGAPQYALMSREDSLALPVASWAENDCHLAARGRVHGGMGLRAQERFDLGEASALRTRQILSRVDRALPVRHTRNCHHAIDFDCHSLRGATRRAFGKA
jgi:ParB-like chromosome segregation protein Spo0J